TPDPSLEKRESASNPVSTASFLQLELDPLYRLSGQIPATKRTITMSFPEQGHVVCREQEMSPARAFEAHVSHHVLQPESFHGPSRPVPSSAALVSDLALASRPRRWNPVPRRAAGVAVRVQP